MAIKLSLPVEQNWSCHACGGCCRQHDIIMTDEERQRIVEQNWTEADGIPTRFSEVQRKHRGRAWHRMRQRDDGSCVFLAEDGKCRIHGKFGEEAKPLACRVYPYVFHPAGGRMAVSLRFSCPSVVRNLGRGVETQRSEIRRIAGAVVPSGATDLPPADLTKGRPLRWATLRTIVEAIEEEIADASEPLGVRLLRVATWLPVLPSRPIEDASDADLTEFLALIRQMAATEVTRDADTWPSPGRTAMTQFRLLAGQYARLETGGSDRSLGSRIGLLKLALRLTGGRGSVPAVRSEFGAVSFETLDAPLAEIPDGVDAILERLLLVKVGGLHFCGRGYYGHPLVEGFAALLLLVASIHYLARWNAATEGEPLDADHYVTAITSADHHHGFSPVLDQRNARQRVRFFLTSGELRPLLRRFACDRPAVHA